MEILVGTTFNFINKFCLFTTEFRPALGPTQPPFRWVPMALPPKVKGWFIEATLSAWCSSEVKNTWSYTSTVQELLYDLVLS